MLKNYKIQSILLYNFVSFFIYYTNRPIYRSAYCVSYWLVPTVSSWRFNMNSVVASFYARDRQDEGVVYRHLYLEVHTHMYVSVVFDHVDVA